MATVCDCLTIKQFYYITYQASCQYVKVFLAGQLRQNFRPLKIKQLRNTASYLSVLIFEVVFVTY